MKLTKKELTKLITEEINLLDEDSVGAVTEEEATDPTQQYIDYIVAVQEAAKDALERLENGAEIWDAGVKSRFNQLCVGFADEDFYYHFFK
jgi:hypothetical protein